MREIIKLGGERVAAIVIMIIMSLIIFVAFPLIKIIAGCAICDWEVDDTADVVAQVLCTMINPFFLILLVGAWWIGWLYYYSIKALFTGKFLR